MPGFRRFFATLITLCLIAGCHLAAAQQDSGGPTPPRLSLIEGEVSFWRPGNDDWETATLNTPLAPGDTFYADDNANLEVQIGNRAFVRAGELTQISLLRREPRSLRFRVSEGQASFDLRALPAEFIVEVETPNAAFTIDRSGYYRLNVDADTTFFSTRRGGRATVVPSGGTAHSVAPSEEVVIEGIAITTLESYAVPERDAWDRWNDERSDQLVDALSARYLPPDVYGAEALDHYGHWRVDPTYGTVWVPSGVPANWAPYSTGRWIRDPYYGWSWIDNAPWGWAPFHYGRWVFLGGFWAWAPGPVAARSVYSPALVGFFSSHGDTSLNVSIGGPALSWVALSWGEPLIPWWGRPGFVGRPWWGGWHGPRAARAPHRSAVVDVHQHYHNSRIPHALVATRHDRFGRGPVQSAPLPEAAIRRLRVIQGELPVRRDERQAGHGAGERPPARRGDEGRRWHRDAPPQRTEAQRPPREALPLPRPQESTPLVERVKPSETPTSRFVRPSPVRPFPPTPFGAKEGPERSAPGLPPRFEEQRQRHFPADKAERSERQNAPRSGANGEEARRAPNVPAPVQPAPKPAITIPPTPAAGSQGDAARRVPQAPGTVHPAPKQTTAIPPPPAAAWQREAIQRAEKKDHGGERGDRNEHKGRAAEAPPKGQDEGQALPGKPANRLSPRRRDQDEREERRSR